MILWSLTTDTDSGIETTLHDDKEQVFRSIASRWFDNAQEQSEFLAAIDHGTNSAGEWLEDYRYRTSSDSRVFIEPHALFSSKQPDLFSELMIG